MGPTCGKETRHCHRRSCCHGSRSCHHWGQSASQRRKCQIPGRGDADQGAPGDGYQWWTFLDWEGTNNNRRGGHQALVLAMCATQTGRHTSIVHLRTVLDGDGQPTSAAKQTPTAHPGEDGGQERAAEEEGQKTAVSGESYYHNTQQKFRRNEGHGPIRMALKARQWENWEYWKAAKQEEMRRSRQRRTDDKARREEEWRKGLHKVFGGGGHEPKATGWVQDVTGGWFEVAIQPERPAPPHTTHDDGQPGNGGGLPSDGQRGDGGSQPGQGQQHGGGHNRQRGPWEDDPGQDNAEGEWWQNQ